MAGNMLHTSGIVWDQVVGDEPFIFAEAFVHPPDRYWKGGNIYADWQEENNS